MKCTTQVLNFISGCFFSEKVNDFFGDKIIKKNSQFWKITFQNCILIIDL